MNKKALLFTQRRRAVEPDSPAVIFGSDLIGWWNATDAANVTVAGGVASAIANSGGTATALTATGTGKPAFGATAFQSHIPGITFDGSNDFMEADVTLGTTSALSAFSFAQQDTGQAQFHQQYSYHATADAGEFSSTSSFIQSYDSGPYPQVYRSNLYSHAGTYDTVGRYLNYVNPGLYRRWCTLWDGTNEELYIDIDGWLTDATFATPIASNYTFGSTGKFRVGARGDGSQAMSGAAAEYILVKRAATAGERRQVDDWFMRHWTRVLVVEGDSLPQSPPYGIHPSYAFLYVPNSSPACFLNNRASGGIGFDTNTGDVKRRAAAVIDNQLPVNKYGKHYVLFVGSTNNLNFSTPSVSDAADAVTVSDAYGVYAAARKAAGYDKVVWSTVLSRADGQQNDSFRNALNAVLMTPGWAAAHNIDAVVDFAADAIMGVDSAPTVNASYFSDSVHPSATGMARLEVIFRAAMNAL